MKIRVSLKYFVNDCRSGHYRSTEFLRHKRCLVSSVFLSFYKVMLSTIFYATHGSISRVKLYMTSKKYKAFKRIYSHHLDFEKY